MVQNHYKFKFVFVLILIISLSFGGYSNSKDIPLNQVEEENQPIQLQGDFTQAVETLALSNPLNQIPKDMEYRLNLGKKKEDTADTITNENQYQFMAIGGLNYIRIYLVQINETDRNLLFVEQIESSNRITALTFHPKSRYLAYGDDQGTIYYYQIKGYRTQYKPDSAVRIKKLHQKKINTLAFTIDGRYILSGGDDNQVKKWDLWYDITKNLYSHNNSVSKISVSSDGKYFASSSFDKSIILFDLESQKEQKIKPSTNMDSLGENKEPFVNHTEWISDITFGPEGSESLISVGYDRLVLKWDLTNKDEIQVTKIGEHKTSVLSVTIGDGDTLLTSGSDGQVISWSGEDKTIIRNERSAVKNIILGQLGEQNYMIYANTRGVLTFQPLEGSGSGASSN